ncbi:site-specific integrase [Mesorhizobium waimense]|uniref:Site-specific integrase n=1 Tax=Mesorhizobium waimense TaxID=1300307 RepID=A0A3A5KSM6_9HYPH|nr:site-specific integrase [Mesorhizobium waimense]RJT36217.1 site-specific integrase [Mesorhizobium waimense]
MKARKLTKTVVDDLEPADRLYRVFDVELKGFCVRVAPGGGKLWQVEYRPYPGGRNVPKKRMTLGATNVLTADDARKMAKDTLAQVTKGADPARDRKQKREEHTVASLIHLYEEEGGKILRGRRLGQPMKPRYKAWLLNRLRHHVLPLLGNKRISEVTPADVEQMVKDVTAGKTAKDEKIEPRRRIIVRGGEGAARKVARDVSSLFGFAIHKGLASKNPVETAAINKVDGRRERYLSLEEVQRLGKALDELEAEAVNPKALDIVRLLALTGCRRDEIAGLKWSEVRLDLGCLVLDATKTGRSVRPLAAPAVALLTSMPRYGDSPYVFPASRGDGHFQGTKRIWPKVTKKAGLPGVTPHTLRHSVGSAAVSGGMALPMVAAILGHADTRSTQLYAHVQRHPAAKAATRAIGGIAAALAGRKPAPVASLEAKRARKSGLA